MHLLTQSALLKALGWSLFNSLWQMALLWLLYELLVYIFKNASTNVRHGLAVLLSFAGAVWTGASFLFTYYFDEGSPFSGNWLNGILSIQDYPAPLAINGIRSWINAAIPYCTSLYLLLVVFFLARYYSQYLFARKLKVEGLARTNPELRVFVEETRRQMGIRPSVQVWHSPFIDVPLTLGFLKPIILLPIAIAGNLTIQQTEAILLHELAHIRRHDYLLNLALSALDIVYFFNPFTRLLIRTIKKEREHRCDDLVIQFRYNPHNYALALLSLAKNAQVSQPRLALAATSRNEQLLLQRVRRILGQPHPVNYQPGIRGIAILLLAMATGLITLSRTTHIPAETNDHTGITMNPVYDESPYIVAPDPSTNELLSTGQYPILSLPGQSSLVRTISVTIYSQKETTISGYTNTIAATSPGNIKSPRCIQSTRNAKPILCPAPDEEPDNTSNEITLVSNTMNDNAPDESGSGTAFEEETGSVAGPRITTGVIRTAPSSPRSYTLGTATFRVTPNKNNQLSPGAEPEQRTTGNMPFVPNSSFTIHYRRDTSRPGNNNTAITWSNATNAQKAAIREIEAAIKIVQQHLQEQLQILSNASSYANTGLTQDQLEAEKIRKQLLSEQLKLQQEYLEKQLELQKRLEKTYRARRVTIVYI